MELNNDAINIVEMVLSVAAIVLPALIALALSAYASRALVEQVRKLWATVRGGVVPAMDEPTDVLVSTAATLFKLDAVQLARITKRAAEFVVRIMDEALEQVPQQEVNIGEATK